jgi:hypothetical protein
MYAGTIRLINECGDVAQELVYSDSSHRGRILAGWKKVYGKRFLNLSVVDIPIPKPIKYKAKSGIKAKCIGINKRLPKSTEGGVIW